LQGETYSIATFDAIAGSQFPLSAVWLPAIS
jgi:hypothetical protein